MVFLARQRILCRGVLVALCFRQRRSRAHLVDELLLAPVVLLDAAALLPEYIVAFVFVRIHGLLPLQPKNFVVARAPVLAQIAPVTLEDLEAIVACEVVRRRVRHQNRLLVEQ